MAKRLSRRQLLARGGAFAAAGAASLAVPGAGATVGSHRGQVHDGVDHLGLDHGGNLVVGDVDLSVFDPTAYMTSFDYGTTSTLPDGRTLREWKLVAFDREIEVAPGVKFAAWTYNGQVPGPTLRCTEGDRLRIHFVNAGSHPHTIHFHGIHAAGMDGVLEVVPARRRVHLRVRCRAVRVAALPLPRPAAAPPHPQGPLRRLHHRPARTPAAGPRAGDDHERVRHQLRRRERGLRRQHRRLPLRAPSRSGSRSASWCGSTSST